jgi:hypothetical protein
MASLFTNGVFQAMDATGALPGAFLYTYVAGTGTATPLATYTDQAGGSPNTNPVECDDVNGQASVWLGTSAYYMILKKADGTTVWEQDNISSYADFPSFSNTSSASLGDALIGVKLVATGATARTQHTKNADYISVKDFGAVGDGVADDTAAIQSAITHGQLVRGEVYFPQNTAGAAYMITAPLTISNRVKLTGAGPLGVQIYGVDMDAGAYILDINCDAADVVEHIHISGIALRSNDGVPHGMRVKNASYVTVENVRLHTVTNGISFDGTRTYSNTFKEVVTYDIFDSGVKFLAGFAGGGQYEFHNCTFTGDNGFNLVTTAATNALGFFGCNFEQCEICSVNIGGAVAGLTFSGCRTEGGTSTDFIINPGVGETVTGLSVNGCYFTTDSAANVPINIGGAGGATRGFSITGNSVDVAGSGTSFVVLNGDGESGIVAGNSFLQANTTAISAPRAGVFAFGNENASGKCLEHWGLAGFHATNSAAPTIASAGTIAPAKPITFISGVAAIATITAPAPIATTGGTITLIPTGVFTWTNAGNIAIAGTAVVSKVLTMTFDVTTTKWYPSYLS